MSIADNLDIFKEIFCRRVWESNPCPFRGHWVSTRPSSPHWEHPPDFLSHLTQSHRSKKGLSFSTSGNAARFNVGIGTTSPSRVKAPSRGLAAHRHSCTEWTSPCMALCFESQGIKLVDDALYVSPHCGFAETAFRPCRMGDLYGLSEGPHGSLRGAAGEAAS